MATEAFPGEKPKKPRKPSKKPMPASLARLYRKALTVSDEAIQTYRPTELVVKCTEAYLEGCSTQKDIAEKLDQSPATVSAALREPVACAWIAKNLNQIISQRLGLVDAALFSRAMTGDPAACKLLYSRYGQLESRHVHVNVDAGTIDYSSMTTEQLEKMAAAKKALSGQVVDVSTE